MLTQVVLNLLTNALDAIEGPGHVESRCGASRPPTGPAG